jgi:hypothetical protein
MDLPEDDLEGIEGGGPEGSTLGSNRQRRDERPELRLMRRSMQHFIVSSSKSEGLESSPVRASTYWSAPRQNGGETEPPWRPKCLRAGVSAMGGESQA